MSDDMTIERATEISQLWANGCQPGNDARCKEYADTDEGWLGVVFEAKGFLDGHALAKAEAKEALKNQDHSSRCAMSRRLIETLKEKDAYIDRLHGHKFSHRCHAGMMATIEQQSAEIARLKSVSLHSCNQKVIDTLNGDVACYKTAWEAECETRRGYHAEIERLTKNAPLVLLERIDRLKEELAAEREKVAKLTEALQFYIHPQVHASTLKELAEERARSGKLWNDAIEAAAAQVETHWNDSSTTVNQKAQAQRSAGVVRDLKKSPTPPEAEGDDFHDRFMGGRT